MRLSTRGGEGRGITGVSEIIFNVSIHVFDSPASSFLRESKNDGLPYPFFSFSFSSFFPTNYTTHSKTWQNKKKKNRKEKDSRDYSNRAAPNFVPPPNNTIHESRCSESRNDFLYRHTTFIGLSYREQAYLFFAYRFRTLRKTSRNQADESRGKEGRGGPGAERRNRLIKAD